MTIQDLERAIDRLISKNVGTTLRGKASELGARLSNEVLSVRGLSEKETARRLLGLGKEAERLNTESGVPGHLFTDFHQAVDLYPHLVEAYQRLAAPREIGERLLELGNTVSFLARITERDMGSPIVRNWVTGVFLADEALKRVAARRLGEKADATPASQDLKKVSWNTATAVAGLAAMTGLFALAGGQR